MEVTQSRVQFASSVLIGRSQRSGHTIASPPCPTGSCPTLGGQRPEDDRPRNLCEGFTRGPVDNPSGGASGWPKGFMEDLLNRWGLVVAKNHPQRRRTIERAATRGELVRVVPGVYRPAEAEESLRHRLGAVLAVAPDAIFTHQVAAAHLWWPDLPIGTIRVTGTRVAAPWLVSSQRTISPDQRVWARGLMVTSPALSALELTDDLGPRALDEAFRRGAASVADLREALLFTAGRPGQVQRQRWLAESKDEPWSPLERDGHRRLRAAGIRGWRANHRVAIHGSTYYLDIALPGKKTAIELDGFERHSQREVFERDRRKYNALVADGWTVYVFTWRTINEMVPTLLRHLGRAAAA